MGKVTVKGQVTIPQAIRDRYGLAVHSEVEFVEEQGRVYLVPERLPPNVDGIRRARGSASVRMSTDEILALTRGED
jgi:AbrB family looped-hinge helix DNA binding protein